ncbi:MAG: hypothetical protein ACYC2H_01990 [Thermoplasmatota archaeon]
MKHNLCDDNQNRSLSWAEGYGNFFGPAVDNFMYGVPGGTGDSNYNRPVSFSRSMETAGCGAVEGDDNEWNVATMLWDIWDTNNDDFDVASNSQSTIHARISACDDATFNDRSSTSP